MLEPKQALPLVEKLFDGITEVKMRELGLEALRKQASYKLRPTTTFMVTPHNWFRELLQLLAAPGTPIESGSPTQLDLDSMVRAAPYVPVSGALLAYHEPAYRFWAWMEQASFALSVRYEDKPGTNRQYPIEWIITTLGLKRLKTEHSLQPGAMQRLWQQFEKDLNESLVCLEDAHTCFERGLYRPAVVLLGLAFEELTQQTCDRLQVVLGKGVKPGAKAWHDALRTLVESQKTSDTKTAALNALNVADSVRNARNDAAHKAASTWTATEVDEVLADGMRAYSKLASYTP